MTNTNNSTVQLASIRLITEDVARLVAFYELVTAMPAKWSTPDFAEVVTPAATLAIGSTSTVPLFGEGTAVAAQNRSAIIEFRVADVDADYARLQAESSLDFVNEPTTMPWGNRSLLIRDPDGSLVNLFTPVTPDAIEKFGRR